jgi:hypothetical protein
MCHSPLRTPARLPVAATSEILTYPRTLAWLHVAVACLRCQRSPACTSERKHNHHVSLASNYVLSHGCTSLYLQQSSYTDVLPDGCTRLCLCNLASALLRYPRRPAAARICNSPQIPTYSRTAARLCNSPQIAAYSRTAARLCNSSQIPTYARTAARLSATTVIRCHSPQRTPARLHVAVSSDTNVLPHGCTSL